MASKKQRATARKQYRRNVTRLTPNGCDRVTTVQALPEMFLRDILPEADAPDVAVYVEEHAPRSSDLLAPRDGGRAAWQDREGRKYFKTATPHQTSL